MDEDNDGRFSDDSLVEVRYPLTGSEQQAGVYILPTVIGIARQVEGLGWVICLNTIPVGWPAALILACLMPRKKISHASYWQRPCGQ